MEYQQTGTHEITPELTLTDFKWCAIGHECNIGDANAVVNVQLDSYNTRLIEIPMPADFQEQTLCDALLLLPAFAGSVPI